MKKTDPSLRDWLQWRFSMIKNNPLLHVLQKEPDIRLILIQFRENRIIDLGATADEYEKEFILGGIDAITLRWLKNDMVEGPEEMVDKVMFQIEK